MKILKKSTISFFAALAFVCSAVAGEPTVAVSSACADSSTSDAKYISRLAKKQEMLMDLKDFQKDYKAFSYKEILKKEDTCPGSQAKGIADAKYISRLERKMDLLLDQASGNADWTRRT